jgi:putative oxidoreductase
MSTFSSTTVRNPTASISTGQPGESTANTVQKVSELSGRILLSVLFLLSGLGKVGAYAGTSAYMSSLGVPGALLPLVIATEVLGALAIIVGWKTRITAFLLAGYSLLTAIIFHSSFGDQIQMIMFFKNVSIAGGFLLLVANGSGPLSIDHRRDGARHGRSIARASPASPA